MPSFNCTNGSPFSTLYVVCNYSVGTANVAQNYTPVTVTLQLVHGPLRMDAGQDDCSVSLGGTTRKWTGPAIYAGDGTTTLGSTTINVSHNSDGTWSGTLSVSYQINITYSSTWISTISGSQSITLPTIPRASSFTVGNITIGSAASVSISRASSSFTHTIRLAYGSLSTQVTGAGTSASITPPMSWCNSITNATSVAGTMTCYTYSGSTLIGSTSKTVTILIPSSAVPTISASTSLISGFQGLYLQGMSQCRVTISAGTSYGSPIRSYSISGGGYTGTSSTLTTGVLNSPGTITFTCRVTDARGRSAQASVSISVTAYSKPTISVTTPYRCTSNGTALDDGTYCAVQASFSGASVSGRNTVSCYAYYRQDGTSTWSTGTQLTSGTRAIIGGGNLQDYNAYDIRIYLYDTVGSTSEYIYTISSSGNYLLSAKLGYIGIGMHPPASGDQGVYMPKAWLSTGEGIEDLRDGLMTPGYFGGRYAKWYFDQAGGNGTWKAVQQIKGWNGADYTTTEVAYPASNSNGDYIYWRTGRNGDWGEWKRFISSGEQISWSGSNSSWVNGRDNARLKTTSINGYSPFYSIKTTNGSWDVGVYGADGYDEHLIFSHISDTNYNNGNNSADCGIRFYPDGSICYAKWGGDTIPLSKGGTGATTANGALANLNIHTYSIILKRNGSTIQDVQLSTLTNGEFSTLPVGGIVYAINGDRSAASDLITGVSKWTSAQNGTIRLVFDANTSGNMRINLAVYYV